MSFNNSSTEISELSMKARQAEIASFKLCGAMLVAIPTAMPEEPLTSKLGILAGKTSGMVS